MGKRSTTTLLAGAALVLLAGCGGDDAPIEPIGQTTTTTSATTTLSKRAFIVRADARCGEANVAIASLSSSATDSLTAAAVQEQSITRGVLSGLDDLNPPDDPSGALERFFNALQEQVNILRNRQNAAASGDTERFNALGDELAQAKADARLAAQEYGFTDCGQEASAVAAPDDGSAGTVPVTPAPAPATPPSGGTGGGTGGDGGGSDDGGSGSGGISPG